MSGADLDLVARETERLVATRQAFRADQFRLEASRRAHLMHTGPEIIRQAGDRIDAFCDFVGSGGSFAGCAMALKRHDPTTRCYVVEPEGATTLAGAAATGPGHRIQGGGYARTHDELPLLRGAPIDGWLAIDDAEAVTMARRLAREEGIFGGFSGGANVAAACRLLAGPCRGGTVAVLICDSGMKYLSTDLWDLDPPPA